MPVTDGVYLFAVWKRDEDEPQRTDPPGPIVLNVERVESS